MTKRTTILLFMAFLISSPIAQKASSRIDNDKLTDKQRSPAPPQQAINSKPLFFQLPSSELTKGMLSLEFRIRVNSLPYLVEKFIINADDARLSPAIEILAAEPDRLRNLYRLARKQKRQVSLIVMIDGNLLRNFSFNELREYNRELKNRPDFLPLAVQSKLIMLRRMQESEKGQLHAASDCEGECYFQYANCAESSCGSPYVECDDCYPQLNACLQQCPPPESCPSTSCSSFVEVIGNAYTGSACFTNIFEESKIFDMYYTSFKKTTVCHTVDTCAGTASTNATYEYFYRWCDYETPFSCSFPTGYPLTCY